MRCYTLAAYERTQRVRFMPPHIQMAKKVSYYEEAPLNQIKNRH